MDPSLYICRALYTCRVVDRQALLTDAAIRTLAQSGLRGLTHRAVDRAAGLAEGSTSYYFRTRDALLNATMARLAELSRAEIAAVDSADLDSVADLFEHWLTAGRDRHLARFELTLESIRRPGLRDALREAADGLRTLATDMLTAAGVTDARRRAVDLVTHVDGLLFAELVERRRSRAELQAVLEPLLRSAFGQAPGPPAPRP
jgi:DNA-binding transcriptional regulator YbjK